MFEQLSIDNDVVISDLRSLIRLSVLLIDTEKKERRSLSDRFSVSIPNVLHIFIISKTKKNEENFFNVHQITAAETQLKKFHC